MGTDHRNALKGERLSFSSDGLPESRDINDCEFGDNAIETIASRTAGWPAGMLVQSLVDEWRRFTGRRAAEDDVSIAVIEKR